MSNWLTDVGAVMSRNFSRLKRSPDVIGFALFQPIMFVLLFSVSGVETTRPTNTSTHENAHAKNSSRATPARNFGTPSLKRQPTARPASSMTIIETVLMAKSVKVRANSTAACDIGNVRNLSTMPSFRSCAMNVPENVAPNTTVWAKMPAMRNSV